MTTAQVPPLARRALTLLDPAMARSMVGHANIPTIAAADVVVLGSSSGSTTLLDVLAAGGPVVAPADAETVPLVVPAIAGIVYRPSDVVGLETALLRLLTTPVLRRGMGGRARHVACRHRIESMGSTTSSGQQEPRTDGSRDDTRAMAADRRGSPLRD
ncbi:MAG TPA: hypothetical protein VFL67_07250 [Mycobacterium sp.]|nr:hypothetical protein [Mycobacterium sp.]